MLGVLSVLLGEIPFCFPNVDFATFTRDPVYSRSVAGIWFILMGVEKSLKFVGRGVVDLDACLLEDALELMRCRT